ncbi:EI24 domain-containing protein [Rhodoferax aquaticus]|uniref:EI24 domain-containing protein n=1 Tax=Rhodoferax aquaticus TaxID=2527691 RepID=A0A515ERG3_9BURK|nr:EI24 domain-containing protein [Rhodoferax aquaticus]QDL55213.1 EI24 domain-containing protein [Rhodoferax aquaticus]
MNLLFDAFWRAVAYCLHPRVIFLSLLPLVLMVALTGGLAYFFWDAAMDGVRATLDGSELMGRGWAWLESVGAGNFKMVLVPLIVILLATPVIVVVCLLAVSLLMTPVMLRLVESRRFTGLERKKGGSFFAGLAWSLGSSVLALLAIVVSMPLWLIPPLVLVLPPLIWGWLTYRVMAYDALADHASVDERKELMRRHRMVLLGMGVFAGFLGAAPSLIWSLGMMTLVYAAVLVPMSIWLYTLVFAFASLWFAHFCLGALHALREEQAVATSSAASGLDVVDVQATVVSPTTLTQ